jgi:hypothetical protein
MAASDAKTNPVKNARYRATFPIVDADGELVSEAGSLDSERSIDGGTFADCSNEAVEIATDSGMYYLDLNASEMNGDTVAIIVKSTSGKTKSIVLYPAAAELDDIYSDTTVIEAWDNAEVLLDTAVDTVNTQTNFTLDAGSNDNDAYNGMAIVLYDASSSDNPSVRYVTDYVAAGRTITIDSAADFTLVSGDGVRIFVVDPAGGALTGAQASDLAAIESELIVVHSETTEIQGDADNIYSDTTVIEAGGGSLTAGQASDLAAIESEVILVHSETTQLQSDTAAIESELSLVHSETTVVQSDTAVIESDAAAVESELILVHSEATVVQSDTAAIESELALVHSETTQLQSDTAVIESDTTAIESDAAAVESELIVVHSETTVIASDTAVIESDAAAIETGNVIADAILKRDWTAVSGEAARSVLNALRALRNKVSLSGSTLTVTEEDDSTEAWTATITTDSGADPITAVDPD